MKATIFKLGGLFVAMVLLSGASSYTPNMRAAVGMAALLTVVLIAFGGGVIFALAWRPRFYVSRDDTANVEIRRLTFRCAGFTYLSLVLGLLCLAQALYAMVRP